MSREQYMPLRHTSNDHPAVSPLSPHEFVRDDHGFTNTSYNNGNLNADNEHEMKRIHTTTVAPQSQSRLIQHDDHSANRLPAGRGRKMIGVRTQIILSLLVLLSPLALSAVLVYLIYAHLELPNGDEPDRLSITENGRQRALADDEYYVNYSATQLVFISSLSSTLALALVPMAMSLFSFTTASQWQQNSSGNMAALPTPFQFKISLQLIQGGMFDFISYLKYICSRKRALVTNMVHYAGIMLGSTLLLAIAITLVDALLHIEMDTVSYNRNSRVAGINFLPGRNLPTQCWNGTDLQGFAYNNPNFTVRACNFIQGGSGASASFTNTTEAYKVMANSSTKNFIQLADDGTTAIITTPKSPDGISFTAQSFASSTTCEMVTSKCDIKYSYGGCTACQSNTFSCIPEKAGLLLNGSIADGDLNLSTGGSGSFQFNWYNTSAKDFNSTRSYGDPPLLYGIKGTIYSAFPFVLARRDEQNFTEMIANDTLRYDPGLQLFASTYGNSYGILSCNTTLYDIVYNSTVNGSLHALAATPMNDTATAPFFQVVEYGKDYIRTGLNLAGASAETDKDLAYQFGRVLDRTFLGMTSGALLEKDAASLFQETSKLVAKVPRAEFIALIVLNCIMPVMGLVLGGYALILVRHHEVAHLQARLGLGGVIAALFEDERLNADAQTIDDLYAEKRGLATSRIAVQSPSRGQLMFAALPEK